MTSILGRPREPSTAGAGRPLPGDELVGNPQFASTRAITIKAPAEGVWPWLVPLGYSRGGFHSYDWIENLLMRVLRNGRPWRWDAWWPPRGCVPRVVGLAALGASPAT